MIHWFTYYFFALLALSFSIRNWRFVQKRSYPLSAIVGCQIFFTVWGTAAMGLSMHHGFWVTTLSSWVIAGLGEHAIVYPFIVKAIDQAVQDRPAMPAQVPVPVHTQHRERAPALAVLQTAETAA